MEEEQIEEIKEIKKIRVGRRKKGEIIKPWGKKERLFVLSIFLLTFVLPLILSLASRAWKIPNAPRLTLPKFNLDLLKSKPIYIDINNNEDIKKQEEMKIKLESLKNEIIKETSKTSGVYAIYLMDLNTKQDIGINETEIMEAASLIKLPVIALMYMQDEDGSIDLETKYALKENDKVKGSGSLINKPEGTSISYRSLINLMGKQSDNTAFNVCRKLLGDSNINIITKEMGMLTTNLADNKTSAKDVGLFFEKLYFNKLINEANKNELLANLTDTIYENYLPKDLPTEIKVSHKYGREVHVINDGGIVYTSNPYILVILTKGIVEKEADIIIPQISKLVFDNLQTN